MAKSFRQWIEFLYGPYFKVVGFFYRTYTANRERVKQFKAKELVATVIKTGAVLILIAWILIWMFASEESRNRLTEEVKQGLGVFETGNNK